MADDSMDQLIARKFPMPLAMWVTGRARAMCSLYPI